MAEKRMFAKSIIDSDAFLDMPISSQCLYFHLGIRADDDGFVNNPKKIAKMINTSDDDIRILLAKKFIINFESGVIVVTHWKVHNTIQKDRYKPSAFYEEKSLLGLNENNVYILDTECIQVGYADKIRIEKKENFIKEKKLKKQPLSLLKNSPLPIPKKVTTTDDKIIMEYDRFTTKVKS